MIQWRPFGPYVTAVLAILAFLYYDHRSDAKLAMARETTFAAIQVAQQAIAQADSFAVVAAEADARADSIERARVVARPAVAKIVAQAPDTCGPAIAALEGQLALAEAEIEERKVAYEEQKKATAELRPATVEVVEAAGSLAKASRPSFLSRIVPDVGFGAAAGVSAIDRKPDAVIGITLSWKL